MAAWRARCLATMGWAAWRDILRTHTRRDTEIEGVLFIDSNHGFYGHAAAFHRSFLILLAYTIPCLTAHLPAGALSTCVLATLTHVPHDTRQPSSGNQQAPFFHSPPSGRWSRGCCPLPPGPSVVVISSSPTNHPFTVSLYSVSLCDGAGPSHR